MNGVSECMSDRNFGEGKKMPFVSHIFRMPPLYVNLSSEHWAYHFKNCIKYHVCVCVSAWIWNGIAYRTLHLQVCSYRSQYTFNWTNWHSGPQNKNKNTTTYGRSHRLRAASNAHEWYRFCSLHSAHCALHTAIKLEEIKCQIPHTYS